jgi:predicted methyltransferase
MKDDLNIVESQVLKIFRNNKKKADEFLEIKDLLDQSLKRLAETFDKVILSLSEKGYVTQSKGKVILTDKGDEYLYKTKLYSDY